MSFSWSKLNVIRFSKIARSASISSSSCFLFAAFCFWSSCSASSFISSAADFCFSPACLSFPSPRDSLDSFKSSLICCSDNSGAPRSIGLSNSLFRSFSFCKSSFISSNFLLISSCFFKPSSLLSFFSSMAFFNFSCSFASA